MLAERAPPTPLLAFPQKHRDVVRCQRCVGAIVLALALLFLVHVYRDPIADWMHGQDSRGGDRGLPSDTPPHVRTVTGDRSMMVNSMSPDDDSRSELRRRSQLEMRGRAAEIQQAEAQTELGEGGGQALPYYLTGQ